MAPDHEPALTGRRRKFVADARRGVLATIAPDGRPRLVPVCFVLLSRPGDAEGDGGDVVVSPIDEKPKRTADPRALARVRDVLERPRAALLVDRWDEDWARLAWVRVSGPARLVEPGRPGHAQAVAALRAKYPQYLRQRLEARPLVELAVERVGAWGEPASIAPD